MVQTKKQIQTLILIVGLFLLLMIVLLAARRRQDIRPRALQGQANLLLSADTTTPSVNQDIHVLISMQLTNPSVLVSGADFILLYDKNKLEVINIVPSIKSNDPDAAFTDAQIVTSGGTFDETFNFLRVSETANLPDTELKTGTVTLANVTLKSKSPGQAIIKFPDDNSLLEIVGKGQ